MEMNISKLETKSNNLTDEIKAKLKNGDREGAKRLVAKQMAYKRHIVQIEGSMAMLEEQKMLTIYIIM